MTSEVWGHLQKGGRGEGTEKIVPVQRPRVTEESVPEIDEHTRAILEASAPVIEPSLSQHPFVGNRRPSGELFRPGGREGRGSVRGARDDREVSEALLHPIEATSTKGGDIVTFSK